MNELVKIVQDSGVEESTAKTLKESFMPFFDQAEEWKKKANQLVVTDESQTDEMKQAREARLALKNIRVAADKKRKSLKEDSIRYGKAVQGVYSVIEYLIVPIEKHLQTQEDFVKIREEQKRLYLHEQRSGELEPYSEFVPYGLDLGSMDQESYDRILIGVKLQLKAQKDEEKRIEAESIALAKKEAEERERIRKENEQLKSERKKLEAERKKEQAAAAKIREQEQKELMAERAKIAAEQEKVEAERKKEREEAAKKLEAERKAREAIELIARKEAERLADEQKAEAQAKKKAAAAPDKNKLESLSKEFRSFELPDMQTDGGKEIISNVRIMLSKMESYIAEKSLEI